MKKFKGFTTDQQFTLLKKLGYKGPAQQDDMDKYLAADPNAAAKLGKWAQVAQQRLSKKQPVQMADGGYVPPEGAGQEAVSSGISFADRLEKNPQGIYDRQQERINKDTAIISNLSKELVKYEEGTPEYDDIQSRIDFRKDKLATSQEKLAQATQALAQAKNQSLRDLQNQALTDPTSLVTTAETADMKNVKAGEIGKNVGKVKDKTEADIKTMRATTVDSVDKFDAATYSPTTVSGDVQNVVDNTEAAQGSVSQTVDAQTMDPEELAQLELEAAQTTAAQVEAVNPRELEPGEAIDGSAVDMAAVEAATQVEAAQADPSAQATVQGQLEELMTDFEGGATPAWAAGAMRKAEGMLAARGLGASSMAGQAVIQAAMEAAVPIAMADAQTYAAFESQNLSNRQQATMFAAQQRAEFLKVKFDQEFQTKVLNASKISDIANMNFTAEQQVALENARLAQSANIANLNAANAKVLADAAAMSQVDLSNLNNRQQAQVQNAQNFLQMDLANLNNRQQTALFKSQAMIDGLFNDQAAENAAAQFNAASQNQVNQFFADLESTTRQFNAEQQNAAREFNADQTNTINRFNATLESERDKFNATNALVIAQANAQWRQDISSAEFQAQHDINMQTAQDANAFTAAQLDQVWQRERDLMSFAFAASENAADRDVSLLLGENQVAIAQRQIDAEEDAAMGAFAAQLINWGGKAFSLW